ncbi:MAG: energy transducer TonB [Bacteroidales bacterium]|nr:energy transducer TonB [Bacteroidales bacterium]
MDFDSKGLIGTVVFHVFILIMFIIFGFRTPLPLPAEEGILINFGDSDFGSGTVEPRQNTEEPADNQPEPVSQHENNIKADDPVMTQDHEDAPAAVEAKPVKKETKKEEPKPAETKPNEEEKEKKEEEKKPTVDPRAMYRGRNTNSGSTDSEGVSEGNGNQGSPTGSENATDRSLGISSGDGVSFSLQGRNPLKLPVPNIETQKEGRVVVEIKVDRSGKVVSAVPGVKGSTTLDEYLLNVAKQSALASLFDNNPNAAYYQTGTITYIFKLK